jgi:hypothetical protein
MKNIVLRCDAIQLVDKLQTFQTKLLPPILGQNIDAERSSETLGPSNKLHSITSQKAVGSSPYIQSREDTKSHSL